MKTLSQEVILEILLRLPVKSLLRFRSVSKQWRALISDPAFAKSHFERSSSLADRIIHIWDSEARSIDFHSSFDDDSAVVKLNLPIPFRPCDHLVRIRGSCRGFVLMDDFGANLFVWNPSTGFYKRLPYFPMSDRFCPFIHGFGYDASDDDYLVVLASYDPSDANFASDFQFFSMKANSWKKIEGSQFPYMNAIDEPREGCFLNEAIHWLAFRHDTEAELILAFNVIERNILEIPLPDDYCNSLEFCYLGTLGGSLSFCCLSDDKADIWLMKEYGIKSSWTKSFVVSFLEIPSQYFMPICLTESGEIVGIDGDSGLVRCNAEGQVVEHRAFSNEWRGLGAARYTESLLSLPCHSGEAGEEDTQQPTITNKED